MEISSFKKKNSDTFPSHPTIFCGVCVAPARILNLQFDHSPQVKMSLRWHQGQLLTVGPTHRLKFCETKCGWNLEAYVELLLILKYVVFLWLKEKRMASFLVEMLENQLGKILKSYKKAPKKLTPSPPVAGSAPTIRDLPK